ncbi:hypothetical protein POM88_014316 [Heracleum sosnowskyi]|uniref:Transposase n=1 Tax=Heracleum sosnowskyi TaxID=360622 RepID=A0AAD8J3U8_9APIA|nr:hypothetical protein POM88_014316 [Heracleum sosnowskyi]
MDNNLDNIPIIVQHNGHWDDSLQYLNFHVFGILVPKSCNYTNSVSMICNELKLQPESTFVKIEYQVKDGYPPFKIVDDMHINFYIELKKKEADFTIYPLCVTTENRDIQISAYSNGSGLTSNDEGMSSNTSYNNSDAVSKEVVEDYVDYAEQISRQMLDMSPEPTTEDEIIEISKDDVINNTQNQELSVLQIYKDKETLQIVLSLYAIRNNSQYKVKKSCKNQYLVECLDKNCNWLLRASRNGNTNQFVIRRMVDSHTCSLEIRFKDKRQATTNVIADVIKHKFSNIKTKYSVADIIRDMKHDHNVEVKYNKSWRSKEKALEIMRGNATESFVELYIVDGTFLKSSYGGTLLVAATQDAGGKIFPLAFGVVDSENDMSLEWFFEKFRIAYRRREDMVIVSDRHESIIKGAKKIYPEVPNVFCIFHLLGNIKSKFKKNLKKIKDAFFSAANAYSVTKFQYHMKELEKVDKRVQVYLEDVGYEKWVKVYSGNNRYSNMTSNVAESLNSVTMSIRELPICTMLESLRALIQKWSWRNRNEANATSTRLTRKYEELLKKNYLPSVDLTVNPTNHILFEVLNGDKKNVVDLNAKSCSCKRDTWEVPQTVKSLIVNPPEGRIRVGRPKKRRCKASWERNGKTLKPIICGKCKQSGHNRRSCRNPVKMINCFL